jgi:hypothetical protein
MIPTIPTLAYGVSAFFVKSGINKFDLNLDSRILTYNVEKWMEGCTSANDTEEP